MKQEIKDRSFNPTILIWHWSGTILILLLIFGSNSFSSDPETDKDSKLFKIEIYSSNPPESFSGNPCDFLEDAANYEHLTCGRIEVPQNYENPEGKVINISYVIIPATEKRMNNIPMIHLTGGPGSAALTKGRINNWLDSPISKERDIILFDQRGIGYSSGLTNLHEEFDEIFAANLNTAEERIAIRRLIENYREQTSNKSIDLAAYHSFNSARDIGALMDHLGYDKYNLYGTSYGTRLARIVQDMFPEKLHSVIHNSPAPLSGDMLIDRLNSYSLALSRIFQYCEDTPLCSDSYPKLKENYLTAIKQIEQQPLTLTIDNKAYTLNAQDAIYFLRRHLYRENAKEQIPVLIQALLNRDASVFKSTIQNEFNPNYNFVMWMAVERFEQYDDQNTAEVIEAAYRNLPLLPVRLGFFDAVYQSLDQIHAASLPMEQRQFRKSMVPTLIMVNHYDPVTPPENGHLFMKDLPNGQLYILDESGHGGGSQECRIQVMNDFMSAPLENLDVSCLNIYKD